MKKNLKEQDDYGRLIEDDLGDDNPLRNLALGDDLAVNDYSLDGRRNGSDQERSININDNLFENRPIPTGFIWENDNQMCN